MFINASHHFIHPLAVESIDYVATSTCIEQSIKNARHLVKKAAEKARKLYRNTRKRARKAKMHVIATILRCDLGEHKCSAKKIFGEQLISPTWNLGKKADIDAFLHCKHPEHEDESIKQIQKGLESIGARSGLTLKNNRFKPKHFSDGVCRGATLYWSKCWTQVVNCCQNDQEAIESMQKLAKDFKGGVPFQGVMLQNYYSSFRKATTYDADLTDKLIALISNYKQSANPQFWEEASQSFESDAYQTILTGVKAYLQTKGSLEEGFTQEVCQMIKNIEKKRVVGIMYASLRFVEDHFTVQKGIPADKGIILDIDRASATLASFTSQPAETYNAFARDAIDNILNLDPGVFALALPSFSVFGKQTSAHAIGVIKFSDSLTFVYDPNLGIGYAVSNEELSAQLENIFKQYMGELPEKEPTEMTFSKVAKRFFKGMYNFFCFEPNPPLYRKDGAKISVMRLTPLTAESL